MLTPFSTHWTTHFGHIWTHSSPFFFSSASQYVQMFFFQKSVIRGFYFDVIKWKHFPRYWPFVMGIHRSQRPVTQSFDVFCDLRLIKRLSKQSRRRWFERPSRSLWRQYNVTSASRSAFLTSARNTNNYHQNWPIFCKYISFRDDILPW